MIRPRAAGAAEVGIKGTGHFLSGLFVAAPAPPAAAAGLRRRVRVGAQPTNHQPFNPSVDVCRLSALQLVPGFQRCRPPCCLAPRHPARPSPSRQASKHITRFPVHNSIHVPQQLSILTCLDLT